METGKEAQGHFIHKSQSIENQIRQEGILLTTDPRLIPVRDAVHSQALRRNGQGSRTGRIWMGSMELSILMAFTFLLWVAEAVVSNKSCDVHPLKGWRFHMYFDQYVSGLTTNSPSDTWMCCFCILFNIHSLNFLVSSHWIMWFHIPSLKLTYPLKIGRVPKGNCIFQPSIFRDYVSFREGIYHNWWTKDKRWS